MKHIETYLSINDYFNTITEREHAIKNASKTGRYRLESEKYLYDRVVLTNSDNPVLFSIATGNGWNYTTTSGVTASELRRITPEELISAISGNTALTSFDEFKYFKNIVAIYPAMFSGCTSLRKLTIPNSVRYVDSNSFNDLPSDAVISYEGKQNICDETGSNGAITIKYMGVTSAYTIFRSGVTEYLDKIIYISGANKSEYVKASDIGGNPGTKLDSYGTSSIYIRYFVLGNDMSVPAGAFERVSGVTMIEIGSGIRRLKSNAFYSTGARKLIIPDTLEEFESYSLSYLRQCTTIITYAKIPPKCVEKYGGGNISNPYGIFTDLPGWGTLYYPEGSDYSSWLDKITTQELPGKYSWNGAIIGESKSARTIVATYSVTSTTEPTKIFNSNSGNIFQEIYTDDGEEVAPNGNHVFSSLGEHKVYFVSGKTRRTWEQSYFLGCKNLIDIVIPDVILKIEYYSSYSYKYAFSGCTSLTGVVMPDYLEMIPPQFFSGSSYLASGYCPQYGGIYYFNNKVAYKAVSTGETSYTLKPTTVTILDDCFRSCKLFTSITLPETLKTICSYAFYNCCSLTGLTIPDSVTVLQRDCFDNCSGMTDISFGSGIVEIPAYCCYSCDKLTGVTFANNINLKKIAGYGFSATKIATISLPQSLESTNGNAFSSCSELTGITIPDNLVVLGDNTFNNCRKLTNVTFGQNSRLSSIQREAFCSCTTLAHITLPNSLRELDEMVFRSCKSLTSVTFGTGLTRVSNSIFLDCGKLHDAQLPDSVEHIGELIYFGCNIGQITVPSEAVSIASDAFSGCSVNYDGFINNSDLDAERFNYWGAVVGDSGWPSGFLVKNGQLLRCTNTNATDITIPNGITYIGAGCFSGFTALTSLTIPDSVTDMSPQALEGSKYINNAYCPQYGGIYYPTEFIAYKNAGTTAQIEFKPTTKTICAGCFTHAAWGDIVIPDSVTKIGNDAFYNSNSLNSIVFGSGITEIPTGVCMYCSNLRNVTVPDTVTKVGDGAFANTPFLTNYSANSYGNIYYLNSHVALKSVSKTQTSYTFRPTTTCIYDACFSACSNVTQFSLPNGLLCINQSAFTQCTSLTDVSIPSSVETLGSYAFNNCTSLTGITIGQGSPLAKLGYMTFANTAIKDIDFLQNTNISLISGYCFYNCGSITSVTIPDTIENLNGQPFYNCNNIKEIVIGNGVTSFTRDVFYYARSSAEHVTVGDGITNIPDSAFSGFTKLIDISFGKNVSKVGYYVFGGNSALTSMTFYSPSAPTFPDTGGVNSNCGRIKSGGTLFYPEGSDSDYANVGWSGSNGLTVFKWSAQTFSTGTVVNPTLECVYSITSTSSATKLRNSAATVNQTISKIEIDGVEVAVSTHAYRFATTGLHTVRYTLTGCNVPSYFFMSSARTYPDSYVTRVVSVNAGEGIKVCDNYAFFTLTKLSSVTFTNSITSLGNSCFRGCSGLQSVNLNGAANVGIFGYCFSGCTSLSDFTMPSGSISIESCCFGGCSSLSAFTIPKSVTSIGSSAFTNCTSLTSIEIPSTVRRLDGSGIFGFCTSLTSATISAKLTTSAIGASLFAECTNLQNVTISPQSALTLGGSMFLNCSSLTTIDLRNTNLKQINQGAFMGCTSLQTIFLPNTLGDVASSGGWRGYIGASAFCMCISLTSFTWSEKLTACSDYTFYGCSSLPSLTLPNTVTNIGAFIINDSAISSMTIPSSVTNLSPSAFTNNTTIRVVDLSKYRYALSGSTFKGCTSLTSVTLPDSLSQIPDSCFSDCTSLTDYVVPESVKVISSFAFNNCNALTSITLNENLEEIAGNTFVNCTNLKRITSLRKTPPTIQLNTFDNIKTNGTLLYPIGSVYHMWLNDRPKLLGYYGWTGQEIS